MRRNFRVCPALRLRLRLAAAAAVFTVCTGDDPIQLFAGGAGWALQFDGVNDHVMLTGFDGTLEETVEMWIQPLNVVDGMGETVVRFNSQGAILNRLVAEGGANFMGIDYNGARAEFRNTGLFMFETPSVKPRSTQNLFHLAHVRNRTHARMYFNGELAGEQRLLVDPAPPPIELLPMLLGARYQYVGGQWVSNDRCFGGIIDEVRLWSVARTQAQIQRYMWQPPEPGASGVVHTWSFDAVGSARDGATFSLGTGDAEKSPVYVPSPVPGVGGPVAVAAKVGGGAVRARLCAVLSNRTTRANVTAMFPRAAALGMLAPEPGTPVPLSDALSDGSGRVCGVVNYTSTQVGAELVPFVVVASLPDGTQLQAWQNLSTMATENHHPAAGNARAVRLDGLTGYASLGSFDFPDPDVFSIGLFVKPHSMYKSAQVLSRHFADGTNLFLVEYNDPFLRVTVFCMVGCFTVYGAYFGAPVEAEGQPVLLTNKTPAQIRDAGAQASHVLVTLRCLFRGNATNPAVARLTVYLNGDMIGRNDAFGACWNDLRNRSDQDLTIFPANQAALAPWELGDEYDPGTMGQHLPGLSAVPSQWLSGTFDRVVFWSRELSPKEAAEAALGGVPGEPDVIARYDFDNDDPDECQSRRLWDPSTQCLPLNDAAGRIRPPVAFPWTNSIIGGGRFVLSPFPQIRGSEIHVTMADHTCTNATLRASDPDGDRVTFRLQAPADGAVLVGDRLQFCATGSGGRRDVTFLFDACDYALCASGLAGLGAITFHVLTPGPNIIAFQALNQTGLLRLVFDAATNAPTLDNAVAVSRLLSFSHPWGSRVVLGIWEPGARALRLVLLPGAWPPPAGLVAAVRRGGGLRDAAETSFPSIGVSAAVAFVVCPEGEVLLPSEPNCTACRGNSVPVKNAEGGELVCSPCAAGLVSAGLECARCPAGRYRGLEDLDCKPCPAGFTTMFQAATGFEQCICAGGSYRELESDAAAKCTGDRPNCTGSSRKCLPCPEGMACDIGSDMRNYWMAGKAAGADTTPRAFPRLLAGFWSGTGEPLSVFWCDSERVCPGGDPGTCANVDTIGPSCASCTSGYHWSGKGCRPCDRVDVAPVVLVCLAGMLLVCMISVFSISDTESPRLSVATVALTGGQLVSTVQMLTIFRRFKVMWQEPLVSLLDLASILTLDVQVLKLDCIFGKGAATVVFLLRLLCIPAMAALLLLIMASVACWKAIRQKVPSPPPGGGWIDVDRFINGIGLLFIMVYISITVCMVEPLQCMRHPNGKQAMSSNLAVLCWETSEHAALVAMSCVGFVAYPVTMLTTAAHVSWRYPAIVERGGGTKLLRRCRFLLARFRPECYYWGFWYVLRNLLLPLIPVAFPNASFWQIFLTGILLVVFLCLQTALWPWRTPIANYSESISLGCILVFVQTASFLAADNGNTGSGVVSNLLLAVLIVALATTAAMLSCALYRVLRSPKKYNVFLSHHKDGAASLARWFKMSILASVKCTVFLDSDELDSLELIVDVVRSCTGNFVLLLTKMTLTRLWCAAEITAAMVGKVNTVQVECCDYTRPDQEFFSELTNLWTPMQLQALEEHGIRVSDVAAAYRQLEGNVTFELHRFSSMEEQKLKVGAVLVACRLTSLVSTRSMPRSFTGTLGANQSMGMVVSKSSNFSSRSVGTPSSSAPIVIMGASTDAEARTTTEVLRLMVMRKSGIVASTVCNQDEAEQHRRGLQYVLVVLTRGLLHDPAFADASMALVAPYEGPGAEFDIVTALADTNFTFPAPEFYARFEASGVRYALFAAYLRRVFNILALPFSPHGSWRIMEVQVEGLAVRFRPRTQVEQLGKRVVQQVQHSESTKATEVALDTQPLANDGAATQEAPCVPQLFTAVQRGSQFFLL